MGELRNGLLGQTAARAHPIPRWGIGQGTLIFTAVLGITCLALGLRLVGLGFGLPDHYHWDEPTLMNRVIRMGSGDLNPHYFYYPSFLMYVGLLLEGAFYAVGHLVGLFHSPDAFATAYFEDSTPFYLIGRLAVALLGTATVVMAFVVGRRFFNVGVGLIGALLLAVAPIHVSGSHFFTTDAPMAFFVMVAYLFIWNVYSRGRWRDYTLTGAAIGVGTATKYLPAILLVSLVLAHVMRARRERGSLSAVRIEPALLVGMAVAAIAFFVASPYVVLDWRNALHDYLALASQKNATGCVGADCTLSFVPYLTKTLPWSAGPVVYLASLIGLLMVPWARGERLWRLAVFCSFPVLYFVAVGAGRQPPARYLVPLAPFLAIGAAAVFVWLSGAVARLVGRWLPDAAIRPSTVAPALTALLAGLAMVAPAADSVQFDEYLTRPDPRTQAAAWFDTHVPTDSVVAVQTIVDRNFLSPPIMTESQLLRQEAFIPANKPFVRRAVDHYYRIKPVYPDVPFTYDVAVLRRAGVKYVVVSSAIYHNVDPPVEDRFYAELSRQGQVAAVFRPALAISGANFYPVAMPTITVYRLPP